MKLRIEIDSELTETEIVIKAAALTDEIADLQRLLQEIKAPRLIFYKGTGEYYLDLSEILFFETEGSKIYAHTSSFMSWSPFSPAILVGYPSRPLPISGRFTLWTSPSQVQELFPFIKPTRRFTCHGTINPS